MTAPKPPNLDGAASAASSAASAAASAASSATSALSGAIPSGADIGAFIREQRQHAKLSLRKLAQDAGVSNPYLSQVERGLRKPSAEILQQLAKGLRISAEQLYVQAGLLEDRGTSQEIEAAIVSDVTITERQKRVLLDIYASFVAENRLAEPVAEPSGSHTGNAKAPRRAPKKSTRKTATTAKKTTAKKSTTKTATSTKKKPTTSKTGSNRKSATPRSKKSTPASNRSSH